MSKSKLTNEEASKLAQQAIVKEEIAWSAADTNMEFGDQMFEQVKILTSKLAEVTGKLKEAEKRAEHFETANHCWGRIDERLTFLEDALTDFAVESVECKDIMNRYDEHFFEIKEDVVYNALLSSEKEGIRPAKIARIEKEFIYLDNAGVVEEVFPDSGNTDNGGNTEARVEEQVTRLETQTPTDYSHAKEDCVVYQEGAAPCPDCIPTPDTDWICDACGNDYPEEVPNKTTITSTLSGVVICPPCVLRSHNSPHEEALLNKMCDAIEKECFGEEDYIREQMKKAIQKILDGAE